MFKHVARTCFVVGIALAGLGLRSSASHADPPAAAEQSRVPLSDRIVSAGAEILLHGPSAVSCTPAACRTSCEDLGYCGWKCTTSGCSCYTAICP